MVAGPSRCTTDRPERDDVRIVAGRGERRRWHLVRIVQRSRREMTWMSRFDAARIRRVTKEPLGQLLPSRPEGLAHDDLRDGVPVGVPEHRVDGRLRVDHVERPTEVLGEPSDLSSQAGSVAPSPWRTCRTSSSPLARCAMRDAPPDQRVRDVPRPRRRRRARARARRAPRPGRVHRSSSESSTWFATFSSAISRSAVRFSVVKNRCRASSALRGVGVDVPVRHPPPERMR